jgi:hypothetical protein
VSRFAFLAGALLSAPLVFGQAGSPPKGFHGPVPAPPASAFTGAKACRECHATTHSSWTNGRHSRMLQEAKPASVIPPFRGALTLRGQEYRLLEEGETYFIIESYLQRNPVRRRVDYTLGSRRVQHYLSRLDDGRIVVLPPSYDVEKKEWFHNLDIVDLEESDAVKVQVWNSNCFGCHVSGEEKGFDPDRKTYRTTWTDFGTSCERCHGPGQVHSAKYATKKAAADDRNTAIVHPRHVDAETSTTLCAQCHALRDITQPGFVGGDNYYDFFTPLLEYAQKRNHDPAYWPNGRPRRFSNEALAFWQSQCYFKGGATCFQCHTDVHEPDIEKNSNFATKQEALCSGCHQKIASEGAQHSRHSAAPGQNSPGCVSCHMPDTVISLRHRMPDHTISVPAPENTRKFGIPNACNECHKDKSAEWSEKHLASWFQGGRRAKTVEDAVAFTLAVKRDPQAVERLTRIAGDPARPPLIRANALGHLRSFGEPAATRALIDGAREAHPLLRAAAVLSLADRGRTPEVRQAMETALKDARRTVRMAAAVGLLNAGLAAPRPEGSTDALQRAMGEHANRARFLNEDPEAQLELGKMYFLAGQWKSAEASVRDALKLNAKIAGGQYFLGLATLGQGRVADARVLLKNVDRKDPHRKDAEAVLAKLPSS